MRKQADLVVVGGGTVGGWAAYFAATSGARDVVVLESDLVGRGASSRAAGVVRAQGGTPTTVRLGLWSIDFYRRQHDLIGIDSGFRQAGYLVLATTRAAEQAGRERVAMQRANGLDVRWLGAEEATARAAPNVGADGHRGGSFTEIEGWIDPPRNVLAYTVALREAGVRLLERTPFLGIRTSRTASGSTRLVGVDTPDGVIATERVILTGGPRVREVGRLVGTRIPVGATRHQVVVTGPHPALEGPAPMVFDIGFGTYWRHEDGGMLWGTSNPAEPAGVARSLDWAYLRRAERRLNRLAPITRGLGIRKAWAATIDFTPDHLPILGPAIDRAGVPIAGVTVASPAGHGMMWGPAIARAAADLALEGRTGIVDTSDLGLDRFDALGRSRLAPDPVALPFPEAADDTGPDER